MSLYSRLHGRLPLKLTALQEHPVVLLLMPCEFRRRMHRKRNRRLIWFIIKIDRPTKLWRLSPWPHRPGNQVNLPFSSYYRSKGTSLPHQLETRSHTTCERHSSFACKLEEAQVVPLLSILLQLHPSSQPEGTTTLPRSLQSATDNNGTPATWTLVLFQQVIDRQDRTQTEGRFSLLELLEIQP